MRIDRDKIKRVWKARSRGPKEQRAMFAKMGASGSLQAKGPSGKRTGSALVPEESRATRQWGPGLEGRKAYAIDQARGRHYNASFGGKIKDIQDQISGLKFDQVYGYDHSKKIKILEKKVTQLKKEQRKIDARLQQEIRQINSVTE